ncbi:MAG: hypothetical protein Q8P41_11910 [Pseudomonadota bacterium]|nr:hypothetical protein [Pseudomonadota bacterium]
MNSRLAPHLAPLALFAAVAVLVTWPAVLHLGSAIPGAATSDAYDHYWGYWWWGASLADGRLPLRTDLSHWPAGGLLWFVDPVGAVLSLPFQLFGGPAVGYTFAVLLQLWGGMAAAYALAWAELRGSGTATEAPANRGAAVLAGIVFGASPYALSLVYSGTVEYLALAPLPLFWLFLRRALSGGHRRDALLAAGCWAWATLGNFYYSAFCGLLFGVALLAERLRRPDERPADMALLERAATVLLAFGVLAAPVLAVAGWTLGSPDAVVASESAPGWSYRSLPATDLATFVHPGDYYFPDNRKMGNHGIIHVNYLGWIAILLATIGAWRWRPLRLPLVLVLILALGPTLVVNQSPIRIGGTQIPLPDTLLYLPGSPFRFVHHPYRLVVLPMLLGAVAAAHALRNHPRLALALAAGVLVETLTVSPAVWPLPLADVTAPDVYRTLHDDDTVEAVWDFPPNHHAANRRYQALAVVHGKRIPYGVNQFLPKQFASNHLVRTLMECLRKPAVATIAREGGRPLDAFLQRPTTSKVPAGRTALLGWGYDVIAVHTDLLQKSEATCIDGALGGGATRDGAVAIYRLGTEVAAEE